MNEPVSSQFDQFNQTIGLKPSIDTSSIGGLINSLGLLNLAFFIIGAIFLFNLIGAGVSYVNSTGSPEAINKANQRLLNSLLGLTIVFGSFIIVRVLSATLGIQTISIF